MLSSCVMGIGGHVGETFRVDEMPDPRLEQIQSAQVSRRQLGSEFLTAMPCSSLVSFVLRWHMPSTPEQTTYRPMYLEVVTVAA
jgi:hypothetical protein